MGKEAKIRSKKTLSGPWDKLLSARRIGDVAQARGEHRRSPYQRDFDRIVFSSAFRRLQDKTQVHPLSESDYVRRRLTHSLEVSCVARSLGADLGARIKAAHKNRLAEHRELEAEVGQIAAAAALAHDIGNPPFGHIGESAIGAWFEDHKSYPLVDQLTAEQRADLESFEGNAQGFRILTKLANNQEGLKLTAATLGAFTKYPIGKSSKNRFKDYAGHKKFGFFLSEQSEFYEVANTVGLVRLGSDSWARHPISLLVEAADDICYGVVDVEDGVKMGRIKFIEAEELFVEILSDAKSYEPKRFTEDARLGWLRAKVIGELIDSSMEAFNENENDILAGKFQTGLLASGRHSKCVQAAKELANARVFSWDRIVKQEIAAAQMLRKLLDDLVEAAASPEKKINSKILTLVDNFPRNADPYSKLLAITDFLSGMTDSFLLQTYRQIHGLR